MKSIGMAIMVNRLVRFKRIVAVVNSYDFARLNFANKTTTTTVNTAKRARITVVTIIPN
jgi:hypothetical protein